MVEVSAIEARSGRRWPLFLGLAALIVAADQLTKGWLVARLAPGESVAVLGDWLRLVHGRNTGGLFGLFGGHAEILAVVSIGVIALIVAYHARAVPSRLLTVTLGLLLGGAIGNLLDRLRLGYVVDFVDAGIGDLRWYTFNVADAAISFALLGLVVLAVRPELGRDRGA